MKRIIKIVGDHIEKPVRRFRVKFWYADRFNQLRHPSQWRIIDVLAETLEGALEIAKYHFFSGDRFEWVGV